MKKTLHECKIVLTPQHFLSFWSLFLATLVALHFTPVSKWVSEWAEFRESVAWSLRACFLLLLLLSSCFLFQVGSLRLTSTLTRCSPDSNNRHLRFSLIGDSIHPPKGFRTFKKITVFMASLREAIIKKKSRFYGHFPYGGGGGSTPFHSFWGCFN